MEFSPLLLAFALVLPAELPDKTMVATLLLSARYRSVPVLLGVAAAFGVQCVLAVAFGSLLTLLPDRILALAASLMFALGAVLLLWPSRGDKNHDSNEVAARAEPAPWWQIVPLSFGVLFTAEWGDASQLAVAALTARSGAPLAVGLGSWLALVTVAVFAVLLGHRIAQRLPTRLLQRIAGAMFAAFAAAAGIAAVWG